MTEDKKPGELSGASHHLLLEDDHHDGDVHDNDYDLDDNDNDSVDSVDVEKDNFDICLKFTWNPQIYLTRPFLTSA